eukprot:SAG31_NODE_2886_length_4952_cov_4.399135_1_plen_79_part_00
MEPHEPHAVTLEVPRDGVHGGSQIDNGESIVLIGFANGCVDVHYVEQQLGAPPGGPAALAGCVEQLGVLFRLRGAESV